jgi:hypothetical protein
MSLSVVTPSNFFTVSDHIGVLLCDNDTLPPTVTPQTIPNGWELFLDEDGQPEVLDWVVGDDFVEVYVLRKEGSNG